MEGDGPIMGTPRASGVLVMGTNLPAVDASAARLMGIDPARVAYLADASGGSARSPRATSPSAARRSPPWRRRIRSSITPDLPASAPENECALGLM
jgi:hypothetical protein